MKKGYLISLAMLIPTLAMAWPWSRDMMNQPSIKPQEGEMPAAPQRSVPVGGYPTRIKDRLHAWRLANPVAASTESIARGRQFYTIFCVPCHGDSGKGDGPVGNKFPVQPMDLTNEFIQKQAFDNWIFTNITFGGRLMPSYRNDLTPEERWDLVNYIKHGLVASPAQQTARQKGGDNGIR
jgi:mono/diheme cytochrome c family protein